MSFTKQLQACPDCARIQALAPAIQAHQCFDIACTGSGSFMLPATTAQDLHMPGEQIMLAGKRVNSSVASPLLCVDQPGKLQAAQAAVVDKHAFVLHCCCAAGTHTCQAVGQIYIQSYGTANVQQTSYGSSTRAKAFVSCLPFLHCCTDRTPHTCTRDQYKQASTTCICTATGCGPRRWNRPGP